MVDQDVALVRQERGRGDSSRGSKVYQALLERIRNGTLPPGSRMREDEIASLLGVSRTPVREALARLQARGLVESARGGWTIVELTRSQVMELYAMRGVLEGAAARFAAENASSSEIAGLKHVAEMFARSESDASERARVNMIFHEAIYEAAHNTYLIRMLQDLNDSLALLSDTTFTVEGRVEGAEVEHGLILAAIEARSPDAAEQAARAHIRHALEARLTLLFERR
ncbi:GntR family transcriptional regulator [Roseibium aggregatum]|uniref:GntR family transcriptional regulator n=1 Tax=Roseibium aggregatum TaxID=187304 RepID=A0A926P4R0_9HYPH|nr:GntR family transcriptional regulator [Roseibium aggregatum]MBD1547007.1 GntR family transcriptional regulator [Roseibium aggregatum]